MDRAWLFHADCNAILPLLPDESCDSLVCDPPAGISFMGKMWDHDHGGRAGWVAAFAAIFRECLRVLKPGAHGLVWALPRTSHWTATALEDAGFEVRDVVTHLFGSGFPKSLDVSKAIDKAAGAERERIRPVASPSGNRDGTNSLGGGWQEQPWETSPATADAGRWQGWGTALKPASEHWILVRKPLAEKNVAANVLRHGTGALNIDGCRIGTGKREIGRWPANLVLSHGEECEYAGAEVLGDGPRSSDNPGEVRDLYNCGPGCPVAELDRQSGTLQSGTVGPEGDSGGASRFFYIAKAGVGEREAGLREAGLREAGVRTGCAGEMPIDDDGHERDRFQKTARNIHPTVKPIELMRYLCRLVTPPGGTVLGPFMGSGTGGMGAVLEGFGFIGIEREEAYFKIAKGRIGWAERVPPSKVGARLHKPRPVPSGQGALFS